MTSVPKPQRVENRKLIKQVSSQRCAAAGHVMAKPCTGQVCAHHVTTKGANGGDVPENLMPLCVAHHVPVVHDQGYSWACDQYPSIRAWLKSFDRWDILDDVDQLDLIDNEKLQIK